MSLDEAVVNEAVVKLKTEILNYRYTIDDSYHVQAIPYADKNGHVFIKFLGVCSDFAEEMNLEERPDWMFDGGTCFFRSIFDVKNNKRIKLKFNGMA